MQKQHIAYILFASTFLKQHRKAQNMLHSKCDYFSFLLQRESSAEGFWVAASGESCIVHNYCWLEHKTSFLE